jgi:hypothetical protein
LTPVRKAFVVWVSLCLVGVGFLGVTGMASAAQNAPSWSTGNQWTYSTRLLTTPVTIVMAVVGQTSLTIGSSTYSVWNLNVSTSATTGGGSISFSEDVYLTVDGLKQAETHSSFLAPTTSTYDPPQPQYVFPLAPGNSWSGTTNVTTTTNTGTTTTQHSYSGTVTAEQTVTVAAGTFTTEVVRSPATGGSYTLTYYSEQAGNAVKTETYFLGTLTNSENLTAYSYSPGFLGISSIVWIVLLVVALIIIVGAVLFFRRRPRVPYPMQPPQQPSPQPYQPPQQPPQQGPPGT